MGYGNPSELLESNMGRILGMIGTKIFDFWIIVYSCRIYKNKVKSLPFRYWVLIILMPFLSAIILNQIFPANHSGNNVMIGYIISVCGVLYLNFSVFNYFESYDKQIRLVFSKLMSVISMAWIMRFSKTDLTNSEQKQKLIDTFVNSVYVYDDKLVILLNYKDGEKCVSFDELKNDINKENTHNNECSTLCSFGDPYGN